MTDYGELVVRGDRETLQRFLSFLIDLGDPEKVKEGIPLHPLVDVQKGYLENFEYRDIEHP